MSDTVELLADIQKEILPFESWERLSGESSSAYAAFCSFRDFGPDRSIRKAVETEYSKPEHGSLDAAKLGKKYRLWRSWSMQFKWLKRAEDYDQYIDRLKQTEVRKNIEAQGEVHRMVTGKMLAVVTKKLDLLNPQELTQSTVTDWVETAIRAEREAAGLVGTKDGGSKKIGSIIFAPEFEGL
jgi:hypothetical protein